MTRRNWLSTALLGVPALLAQQSENKAPIAENPVVELTGTIARVQVTPGQGMPMIEVSTSKGSVKVVLGSMRYLLQQNFNPRAGEPVQGKGYQVNQDVVAIRVELPESETGLVLRDENGRPVWMHGRFAQKQHPSRDQ